MCWALCRNGTCVADTDFSLHLLSHHMATRRDLLYELDEDPTAAMESVRRKQAPTVRDPERVNRSARLSSGREHKHAPDSMQTRITQDAQMKICIDRYLRTQKPIAPRTGEVHADAVRIRIPRRGGAGSVRHLLAHSLRCLEAVRD